MDIERATEILRRLADGLDPETGQPLPAEHRYQHPDAIRAMYTTLHALEERRAALGRPAQAFRPWQPDDEARLRAGFAAGRTPSELAAELDRSRGAVRARLVRLGLIEPSSAITVGKPKAPAPPRVAAAAESPADPEPVGLADAHARTG